MFVHPNHHHHGKFATDAVGGRIALMDSQSRYVLSEGNGVAQAKSAEDLKELATLLMELEALDDSLGVLFSDPPSAELVEHQVLVEFRGKVARRVSRYSHLVRKCCALSEMLPQGTTREAAKAEYEKHVSKLQEYKNRLSIWWSKTERSFHMMRMASLVSEMELTRHAT